MKVSLRVLKPMNGRPCTGIRRYGFEGRFAEAMIGCARTGGEVARRGGCGDGGYLCPVVYRTMRWTLGWDSTWDCIFFFFFCMGFRKLNK